MSVQYKKIVIVRIDKIGDLLLTTPVLKLIKKQWPNTNSFTKYSKKSFLFFNGGPKINFN